ncbi:formate/nitrite transporter family protein [Variovorax saccharolyticus]|uniref:formate/nitrite transporter family protein n=1 Tax=Variovorax saccharolyticus TaxID=3053516 RepID=UPI002575B378|nr:MULTISPECIES: formate/nitrite transporter family protein [unclassified Variovorax]MDM0022249.1 formate/nitrite transporter family protein [Variovorax sp. J22R187]MDM0028806.1 formate/nitrite transporter family protein [Variovorax sp. J31P216]
MYAITIDQFADAARDKVAAMQRSPFGFLVAAMLAGGYIGIANILAISCATGLTPGARPSVLGATFGVGLILIAFAGAELFTGCVMLVGFGLTRQALTVSQAGGMLVLVWFGNLAGAIVLAGLFIARRRVRPARWRRLPQRTRPAQGQRTRHRTDGPRNPVQPAGLPGSLDQRAHCG